MKKSLKNKKFDINIEIYNPETKNTNNEEFTILAKSLKDATEKAKTYVEYNILPHGQLSNYNHPNNCLCPDCCSIS